MLQPTEEEKIKYSVDYYQDTDFSAYARLLQSKWREGKGLPFEKYGNFLPKVFAKDKMHNFITDKIKVLVQYELYRAGIYKKLFDENRLWSNLLSSQPLCFNLFGEMHFNHELATNFFKTLFPDKIDIVTDVLFEHSPGRGDKNFTGDYSAFDVFIEYTRNNIKGFIGIEVKYAESLEEGKENALPTYLKHKKRYDQLTTADIFQEDKKELLKTNPNAQIWRDHLLTIATKIKYNEGFFVFLYPKQNIECQSGVDSYINCLTSKDENITGFYPRHLETFISTLQTISKESWIQELSNRYLGY